MISAADGDSPVERTYENNEVVGTTDLKERSHFSKELFERLATDNMCVGF